MREKRSKSKSTIGENIRRYRVQTGETQQQLGDFLGYGATTIANYESGYRQPDVETLARIAEHYHVSLSTMLEGGYHES